jgi:flavin-dependent dehydrogenase
MLANDGHDVTVLERDPEPPPPPREAWERWDRRGVNQFRMLHNFLPRFWGVADAELPGLTAAMVEAGCLDSNPLLTIPASMTGGPRPGDDRFRTIYGRRPVVEAVVAHRAAAEGLDVRRGVVATGLVTEAGTPMHVRGVVPDRGDELLADVVVDASGRRSPVADWLRAAGSPGPAETNDDSGFVYYGRHYRSPDGHVPPAFGPPLQHYGSISLLSLAADNGTWGLGVITSAKDAPLRALAGIEPWERVVGAFPLMAHWLQGEPITEVKVMARIADRKYAYVVDGRPVATGVVALSDAWACTNPSLGRGASFGMTHAVALRDLLREVPVAERHDLVLRWHDMTAERLEPYIDDTIAFDRHRLAEIEAAIDGRPYETDDPAWARGRALASAAMKDPDLLRASMAVGTTLERARDVFARPGVTEKVVALADPQPLPGPDRVGVLALAG